ncbi:protein TIFY 8-like isoform X2 [Hibiscus syriacus]|uniref:protein TIFY 8-like isoform X2 n=1 Tax=Hibiscus syriacus TaxID=106335 RepID=UPI001922BC19|nr:protein TIFY 8-like isoform X2 [Hibiscus syriacus]
MALLKMAQPSKTTNIDNVNANTTSIHLQHHQVNPTMVHDFLGMKASDSPLVLAPKATAARVSEASASASASSTSAMGSVGQVGNHLEGIPYYGPKSDISGTEISNRLVGSKRSKSDSLFMGHESLESLHLMKMLHNGAGGERPRRTKEDEVLHSMQSMRPSSASLISLAPTGSRPDGIASKWEQSIPVIGSAVQYGTRGGHFMPFMHQVSSDRFKDTNVGPVISPAAADEGSRTGIKVPDILSSINAPSVPAEKNSSGVVPTGSRPKSRAHISDPESSVPPSRRGLTSTSRQMTIFYAGQAHVFDDVHPNKADVIMALAGSNGGSWSTTYSPKSATRPASENHAGNREFEAVVNMPFSQEFQGRIAVAGNTSQGTGSGERTSIPTGVPQGAIVMAKEARNPELTIDDKKEILLDSHP